VSWRSPTSRSRDYLQLLRPMTNSAAWQHEHEYVNTTTRVGQLSPAGDRLSVAFLVHMVVCRERSVSSQSRDRVNVAVRGPQLWLALPLNSFTVVHDGTEDTYTGGKR